MIVAYKFYTKTKYFILLNFNILYFILIYPKFYSSHFLINEYYSNDIFIEKYVIKNIHVNNSDTNSKNNTKNIFENNSDTNSKNNTKNIFENNSENNTKNNSENNTKNNTKNISNGNIINKFKNISNGNIINKFKNKFVGNLVDDIKNKDSHDKRENGVKMLSNFIESKKSKWGNLEPEINRIDAKLGARGGVILICEDKILLVFNRESSKWSFPKGHAEKTDLSFYDVAFRELYEETGITLSKSSIHSYKWISVSSFSFTVYYFALLDSELINTFDLIPIDKNEIETVQWISVSDIGSIPRNFDLNKFHCDLRSHLTHIRKLSSIPNLLSKESSEQKERLMLEQKLKEKAKQKYNRSLLENYNPPELSPIFDLKIIKC